MKTLFFPGSPESPYFCINSKGNDVLIVNGIRYRVNKSYNRGKNRAGKVRWRCATHEKFSCRAKVHTVDNQIVYFIDEHIVSMDL